MEKLTKKQKIFLISYPLLHCFAVILFLMMAVCRGFLCGTEETTITTQQEIISAIGGFFINILLIPFFLLEKIGVKLPHPVYSEYLYMFLIGIVYGYIMLYTYKFLRKR